ncbi:5-demethoxyubiquinone hydroxylase, mitochondrial [Erysiphe neolycopersici]|uniref:5-demethoxyubiquinone hydroxylase, mitochondrial n=1 Tax=Erysiphe neolycopersici TaxID=212602 RepID=A0A420HB28_9PEZI|nr:5-demethoxyubiquinone hydroxylase, mitochondrial [Erysiphe neolycopersici]
MTTKIISSARSRRFFSIKGSSNIGIRSRYSYNLQIYDFLLPSDRARRWISSPLILRRLISTSPRVAAEAAETVNVIKDDESSNTRTRLSKPLSKEYRDFLSSAIRVNQAGELAATTIYKAQTAPLVNSHPNLRPLIKHMYDQENGHFETFNRLITKHRVRPTVMYPVWKLAASVLGWGTAIMGREAAMACTEAVETEIGTHYNSQVQELLTMASKLKEQGLELGPDLENLIKNIRRIRDEELEHLDHAVENDAKNAVPHDLLTAVIRAGCRGAIWVSERI